MSAAGAPPALVLVITDLAPMRDEHRAGDPIVDVEIERALFDDMLDQRLDIAAVHLAGVGGYRRRQVADSANLDTAGIDRLAVVGELAVAAGLGGQIHDDGARLHR